ncbi:MAG: recombinase RecB [Desulfurococcaceae archaeon]|uniref:Recombinase RecB n=1 Tax=Staphylothermus marinus TaxID=2280 RepID=A0A7J3KFX1_STAMA
MSISQKRKWRSSEEIAVKVLEKNGFRIIDRGAKIVINGIEVGEVDAIAEDPSGVRYAVEIKAGTIDINGIRQAYVNSQLLGYKPLIVAKGFADESAEILASNLGVKTLLLSDQFIIDAEELEVIVETAFWRIIENVLDMMFIERALEAEDEETLNAMVKSGTIKELAESLNCSIEEAVDRIRKLQDKNVLGRNTKNYQELRLQAKLILLNHKLNKLLTPRN